MSRIPAVKIPHDKPRWIPGIQERPPICASCPTREYCTHSKDYIKTVQRHIWKDYEELAEDARYTQEYQALYKKRKETIERDLCGRQRKTRDALYAVQRLDPGNKLCEA